MRGERKGVFESEICLLFRWFRRRMRGWKIGFFHLIANELVISSFSATASGLSCFFSSLIPDEWLLAVVGVHSQGFIRVKQKDISVNLESSLFRQTVFPVATVSFSVFFFLLISLPFQHVSGSFFLIPKLLWIGISNCFFALSLSLSLSLNRWMKKERWFFVAFWTSLPICSLDE